METNKGVYITARNFEENGVDLHVLYISIHRLVRVFWRPRGTYTASTVIRQEG
jgi:hypothetical protein